MTSRLRLIFPAMFILMAAVVPARAVTVNGFVKRPNGNPVADVDLDVFDAFTGAFVFILNDRTGSDGFYQIVLNPGTYNITYTPPPATNLAAYRRAGVVVSGNSSTVMKLPLTTLEPGKHVTGHVEDTSVPAAPASGVAVRFFDAATGLSVFAANNTTNASGDYAVVVPARTYDLIFAPAAGDTLLPLKVGGVVIAADVALGATALDRGVIIQGDVLDPATSPVAAADADVFDAFTGRQVLTVHDDSDASGHFAFAVPVGTFDIQFFQPAGSPLAAIEIRGVIVAGASTLPPVTLPQGVTLSGRVIDAPTGQPVEGVDLTLVDLDARTAYPVARDNTDALGVYAVNVPPGLYDVRFNAVTGSGLASAIVEELSITGATALADVSLPAGRTISGRMLDLGAGGGPQPAGGIDFVAFDDVSGSGFPVAGADSAPDGTFAITLPPGRWNLEPIPPLGSPLLAVKLPTVDTTAGDVPLGDVGLLRGVALTGRVLDAAGPVRDVDIDVIDALGARLLTPRDNTDPLGVFSVMVPDGAVYTVELDPPRSTDLAASGVSGVAVSGPTAMGDTVLARGVVITGRVVGPPPGQPVFDVDLNLLSQAGLLFKTPHDNTLSDGTFKVVIPPAGDPSATMNLSPPRGSRLLFASLTGLNLTADTALGDIALDSGFLVSGRVTRPDTTGVRDVDLTVFDLATGLSIRTPHDTTDGAGNYVIAVPAADYDIDYVPPPPQPAGERLVPGFVPVLTVSADTSGVDVALQAGVWVKGKVVTGSLVPVASANLDFIQPGGAILRTPRDRTDASGTYSLVVPPDSYTMTAQAPAGSRLIAAKRAGVSLLTDNTSMPPMILHSGYFLEGFLFDNSANPVDRADVDLLDPATGAAFFTLGDNTDGTGFYSFAAPPGVWDLRFTPRANDQLPSFLRVGEVIAGDTTLSDTFLPEGFRVDGAVFDSGTTPISGVEVLFEAGGRIAPAQGNVSDATGAFRTFVPAASYAITFMPPAGSGFAPETRAGVVVAGNIALADAHLAAVQPVSLAAIGPAAGPAEGGTALTLTGSGFGAGTHVTLGGREVPPGGITSTSIAASAPPHPPSVVDVAVSNPGGTPSVLPGAFEYLRRPADIVVSVGVSGDDLILSWAPTGQGVYSIFRASSAPGMREPVTLGTTTATSFIVKGGAHAAAGQEAFYDVE